MYAADSRLHGAGAPGEVCTLWHDGDGHVWQYPNHISVGRGGLHTWGSPEAGPQSERRASHPAEARRPSGPSGETPVSPWVPFMSCLNRRREKLLSRLDDSGLPHCLVHEVRGLLAVDAGHLVGLASRTDAGEKFFGELTPGLEPAKGPKAVDQSQTSDCTFERQRGVGWMPCWLHGDLTSENVLVERPAPGNEAVHVNIIDFADGGHGDPLYDLVMLFLCVFE